MQATLDPKQLQGFRDPVWRISNLYAIRTSRTDLEIHLRSRVKE